MAGGLANQATEAQATVAGGTDNLATNLRSTVGGGISNRATGLRATVGGGQSNQATNNDATIGGGANSVATGLSATVPGGSGNEARGDYSLAAGRRAQAQAAHNGAFVWADSNNLLFSSTAANQFSVRATGGTRLVSGVDSTGATTSGLELPANTSGLSTLVNGQPFEIRVNGSRGLRIEPASDGTNQSPNVIGGTASNLVNPDVHSATIGGGGRLTPSSPLSANRVTDSYGTVGGGGGNRAGDDAGTVGDRRFATVGGGDNNRASGEAATVGGGDNNTADGFFATVGGGTTNSAPGGSATVNGGRLNQASGVSATVPGGSGNIAQGDYSLASGVNARAIHDGTFVWADVSSATGEPFPSTADNQFSVRSTGGARFVSDIDAGGTPTAGRHARPRRRLLVLALRRGLEAGDRPGLRARGAARSSPWSRSRPGAIAPRTSRSATSARWRRTSSAPSGSARTAATSPPSTPTASRWRRSRG